MRAPLFPCDFSIPPVVVLLMLAVVFQTTVFVTSTLPGKSAKEDGRQSSGRFHGSGNGLRQHSDNYRYRGIRHSRTLLSASERSNGHHRRERHSVKASGPRSNREGAGTRARPRRLQRASSGVSESRPRSRASGTPPEATTYSAKRRMARKEGDIILGALFPVHHHPPIQTAYSRVCGKIREYYGIQRIETFLHTVDEINRNNSILPNIRLGWDIRDSCWYSAIALEQSIDFIQDAIASKTMTRDGRLVSAVSDQQSGEEGQGSGASNNANNNASTTSPDDRRRRTDPSGCSASVSKPIVGLVGPGSSEATIQVQNLLQIFNIPQIGYSATSMDLSDKNIYRYFLRVVPPDNYQVQALVDLVLAFNWTYISTVHSDDTA